MLLIPTLLNVLLLCMITSRIYLCNMHSVLLIFLAGIQLSFTKSIQNQTVIEDTVDSRLDKIEAFLWTLGESVKHINSTLAEKIQMKDPVLFFAIIDERDFTLSADATIVFDTVIINEGDHYNKYDGVFVAPRDGIYMFSWTVSTAGANYIMSELVVEEKIISSTGERNSASGTAHMSASMTAMCRMKKDNHAWIRSTGYAGGGHYIENGDNYPRTTFLGMIINPIVL